MFDINSPKDNHKLNNMIPKHQNINVELRNGRNDIILFPNVRTERLKNNWYF